VTGCRCTRIAAGQGCVRRFSLENLLLLEILMDFFGVRRFSLENLLVLEVQMNLSEKEKIIQ
jgi:hypothetical protein